MPYELDCDACDFAKAADEDWDAYGSAKEHEADNPSHSVEVLRL